MYLHDNQLLQLGNQLLRASRQYRQSHVLQPRAKPFVDAEIARTVDRTYRNEMDFALFQRFDGVEQDLRAAAFIKVGDEDDGGAARVLYLFGGVLQREVDVRAAAQLRTHQHLKR